MHKLLQNKRNHILINHGFWLVIDHVCDFVWALPLFEFYALVLDDLLSKFELQERWLDMGFSCSISDSAIALLLLFEGLLLLWLVQVQWKRSLQRDLISGVARCRVQDLRCPDNESEFGCCCCGPRTRTPPARRRPFWIPDCRSSLHMGPWLSELFAYGKSATCHRPGGHPAATQSKPPLPHLTTQDPPTAGLNAQSRREEIRRTRSCSPLACGSVLRSTGQRLMRWWAVG
jgi:hypothetical protein